MQKIKRSTDEIIVLALCVLCMLGLALFAVIRYQRGDMAIAVLDVTGFIATVVVFIFVYRTQSLRFAGPALGIVSLAGAVTLVALGGPDERFLLYPTTVVTFFLMRPKWALISTLASLVVASFFILPVVEIFVYGKFLLSVSGCFLFAYIFARERNIQRDELLSLSTLDALTGVGNRRAFDDQLQETLRIQERNPGAVSLLLLDLDNFKEVNDTLGHDAGDRVLKAVAEIITARMRAGDHSFRFGGDEFAILASGQGVTTLAEDLCTRVSEYANQEALPISISIGVAAFSKGEAEKDWLKRSDSALYKAKTSGRNQVCEAPAEAVDAGSESIA